MFDDLALKNLHGLLSEDVLSDLLIAVVEHLSVRDIPAKADRLTRLAARKDAQALADHALMLARLLKQSHLVPSLGTIEAIRRGGGRVDEGWLPPGTGDDSGPARLAADLMRLRTRALAVLAATDGCDGPQLVLPERGTKRHPATTLVHIVMFVLLMNRVRLNYTESGVAVQVVGAVLQAVGQQGNERHLVREWLDRHPEAPGGGRILGLG